MDFGFSQEQELSRQTARSFLEKECPSTFVRRMMDDAAGITDEFWKKLAELGWLGLVYPESYGGLGLGFVDLTVILEEMGRAVMPGPFFSTVLLGGLAILEAGSDAQKTAWLPKISTGEARATLALAEESGRWDAAGVQLAAKAAKGGKGGYVLSGTKLFVPDAHTADVLVVAARTGKATGDDAQTGIGLFLVPTDAKGVSVTLLPTMDQTRKLCEVTLSRVEVGPDALLGAAGGGWTPLARVLDRATVGLCAEMCGGAQKVLDMCTEYAKIRVAFGKPIGTYQAVKHKCADMLVAVENAKSITYYAAWAVDEGVAEAPLAASMAKAYVSDAYRKAAGDGIQIHGGIGFTWEHDLHLYFKRAKGSEVTFGDATFHRERVAQLINL
ncbi:MAG TPA: acyl-CoA dehydrogenase family protein [Methylomirabilota bacterium]|jgi:alkylation response protein AidB-like acyl-CoA dehydrogenase|nr:acyl-CoA dehydrogenase family protein [Methylomirabilota bacterium]